MILLNFSYPFTNEHLTQVETLMGRKVDRVIEVNSEIDPQQPLVPRVVAMAGRCGLSPVEWQTLPILGNPPPLHWVAVTLLAEIHGRCGYFPFHLRLMPVGGPFPIGYEVAEVLNLQEMRYRARWKEMKIERDEAQGEDAKARGSSMVAEEARLGESRVAGDLAPSYN